MGWEMCIRDSRLLYGRQMPLALAKSAQYYPIVMPRTTGGTAEVPPPVQSFLDADRHEARLPAAQQTHRHMGIGGPLSSPIHISRHRTEHQCRLLGGA